MEFNFEKSWTAYKAHLSEKFGREPTTDEVREEMNKWGWEFVDEDSPAEKIAALKR